jgi:hypothetical protein
MPANIYWVEEPYILATEYTGNVTEDDSEKALKVLLEAAQKGPLYNLVDMREATTIHNNVFRMRPVVDLINHPNTHWLAVVKPNVIAKFAIQVLVRHKAKVFDTREEAEAFLRERLNAEQKAKQQSA